jgi:phosphopantetheinyl transferase
MMGETVHAFVCDTSTMPVGRVAALLRLLSPAERERSHRFAFEEDRRDYVAAHALLRLALADRVRLPPGAIRFGATARGKPYMIPKRPGSRVPAFSLSHSRGRVACAIGQRKPVGIDVEAVDHRVQAIDIARQFFSSEEAAALERCSADQRSIRFCELWTRHEALAKARGWGIARGSSRVIDTKGWTFLLATVGVAHRLTVAARRPAALRLSVVKWFA